MDIQEAQEKKSKLEEDISTLLRDFIRETGLKIDNIAFSPAYVERVPTFHSISYISEYEQVLHEMIVEVEVKL